MKLRVVLIVQHTPINYLSIMSGFLRKLISVKKIVNDGMYQGKKLKLSGRKHRHPGTLCEFRYFH